MDWYLQYSKKAQIIMMKEKEKMNTLHGWVNEDDAIAFHNYRDYGSAQWRSIHCELPTTEEEGAKWIANHWYRMNALAEI